MHSSYSSKTSTIFISKALRFDSAISFASPCPLTSLVGLISKLYSNLTTIHFPLLPSGSSIKISLTIVCDQENLGV